MLFPERAYFTAIGIQADDTSVHQWRDDHVVTGLAFGQAGISPLGDPTTPGHREALKINIGSVGPPLSARLGMNRENAIEGRAKVQMFIDQNRSCLPRRLERGFSTQPANKVLALSKIT